MENLPDFLPLISGAVGGAAAAGVFRGPIQTLEDWWYVTFGYEQSNKRAELIAKQEVNVEKLKTEILDNAVKIDPENIQEPQLKIIGPALEASKYYIEEGELRDMFAKLIASSLDSSKNDINHSSFVEIIKQLNPIDAKIISEVYTGNTAIAQVGYDLTTGGHTIQVNHLFVPKNFEAENEIIEASIDNLIRLGLVTVSYDTYSLNEEHYNDLMNSDRYKMLEHSMTAINDSKKAIDEGVLPKDRIGKFYNFKAIKFVKGLIKTTKYGENFCDICLPN